MWSQHFQISRPAAPHGESPTLWWKCGCDRLPHALARARTRVIDSALDSMKTSRFTKTPSKIGIYRGRATGSLGLLPRGGEGRGGITTPKSSANIASTPSARPLRSRFSTVLKKKTLLWEKTTIALIKVSTVGCLLVFPSCPISFSSFLSSLNRE